MSAFTTAAREAVSSSWEAGADRVYAPGKVPQSPVTPYVVMYGDAGRDDTIRNDATAGSDAFRLMPMVVGKTDDEVGRGVSAVKAALRGRPLTVAGFDCTPLLVESAGNVVRDPDAGGLLSLTLFLTFHAYPTENE